MIFSELSEHHSAGIILLCFLKKSYIFLVNNTLFVRLHENISTLRLNKKPLDVNMFATLLMYLSLGVLSFKGKYTTIKIFHFSSFDFGA